MRVRERYTERERESGERTREREGEERRGRVEQSEIKRNLSWSNLS